MSEPMRANGLDEGLPPDIMNDQQYAINTNGGADGEPDSCRICRSEGSSAEPLFHPCKCSGSIKHVHQECLMLWLSHSQKKYCELCKTPFRFTKLYSPNMPKTIPFKVLVRHLGLHCLRYLRTWLRLCAVVVVWLVCLPYAVRQVWSLLFWFSDGGWPPASVAEMAAQNHTISQTVEIARDTLLVKLAGNGTCPVTPLAAAQTSSATIGSLLDKIMVLSTLKDPLLASLFTSLYASLGLQGGGQDIPTINSTILQRVSDAVVRIRNASLLSDVAFLSNMTPHPKLNQLIIRIAEGYIITILVVVSFILVFLIREWVVQQQPGINMGAGFNARLADADRPRDDQADPLALVPAVININQAPEAINDAAHPPERNAERRHDPAPRPGVLPHVEPPRNNQAEDAGNIAWVNQRDPHNIGEIAAVAPNPLEGLAQLQRVNGAAVRIPVNLDVEIDDHDPHEIDSDEEPEEHQEMQEPNNLNRGIRLDEIGNPVVDLPPQPRRVNDRMADWFWGGVGRDTQQDEQDANDEEIVLNAAAEVPFLPVANAARHDHEGGDGDVDQGAEVVEALRAAGLDPNDPDALDDAEDFEGIMELIGMRGPFFNLIQNALFSAFLLTLTLSFGIWFPYNVGRIALLLVAHPGPALKLPLRLAFSCAALLQDLAMSIIGLTSYCAFVIATTFLKLVGRFSPAEKAGSLGVTAWQLSASATDRILDGFVNSLINFADPEIFAFSAASHESLINIKILFSQAISMFGRLFTYHLPERITLGGAHTTLTSILRIAILQVSEWPTLLAKPESWVISLEVATRSTPLNMELSFWNGWDRFWATFAGYTTLSVLGVLYVRRGSPFSATDVGREWEASIVDVLNQGGGVLKVILIISIEMLAFPLYCGLLLDLALLPLFANATIASRIAFTSANPLTSIFVHWFVGTCYMFHFALFVSMCRKIMRKGVLYFIRDPDDPTFHPVRDVLERNIMTQLRKILFSALIYGALVIICLGGVVWTLAYTFKGVLPVHWSSNEPVLEFPIDLLFYNFLMPLAVRFFKPSDGLHSMYSWWFRRCARMLRLTWFMFGERQQDEEGYAAHRDWMDIFRGVRNDHSENQKSDDGTNPLAQDLTMKTNFYHDGKYVRAPASDQVRIPKGVSVFLEVDEKDNRIDGKEDRPDEVHRRDSTMYTHVYIPPWFRVRICLFILFIWLFAAITGVSTTLLPLVVGRKVFATMIPNHVRKNDVYAFSIGIYILGTALYASLHLRNFLTMLPTLLTINASTPQTLFLRLKSITSRLARIAITYTAFLLVLPALFAFFVEFYFIVPLHTYFAIKEDHVMHLVQSWTLGLLYVKLTTRIILWHENSRPAQSIRAITRNGYLNPDARLAMRAFVIPASLVLGTALFLPWAWARICVRVFLKDKQEIHHLVYRFAYPMALAILANGVVLWKVVDLMRGWRMRVRDEVYLIGERLQNFGDRKPGGKGLQVHRARRITT